MTDPKTPEDADLSDRDLEAQAGGAGLVPELLTPDQDATRDQGFTTRA